MITRKKAGADAPMSGERKLPAFFFFVGGAS